MYNQTQACDQRVTRIHGKTCGTEASILHLVDCDRKQKLPAYPEAT